ncbi:MAG: DUF4238 domain-containing protein [Pseudomonadota bacterium]
MSGPQPRTKLQHYVPRFHLKRFANSEGQIWVFDIITGEARLANPNYVGAEKNYYSPIQMDGSRFDELEELLSKIESTAAPLIEPLVRGRRLIGSDRKAVADFLSMQYLRSPMMIEAMADMLGQLIHKHQEGILRSRPQSDEVFDEIDRKTGVKTSPPQREEIREKLLRHGSVQVNVMREIGLPVVLGYERIAKILQDLTWVVFDTSRNHMVTSDSPVVKVYDQRTYHSVYGDGGFLNKSMYVTFPLGPNRVLELFWGSGDPGGVQKADSQGAKLYNKQRVLRAVKSIFSSANESGISRLIVKYAQAARPRITFGGPTPMVSVKRSLPD